MKKFKLSLLLLIKSIFTYFFILFSFWGFSQTITFTNPTEFFVCDTAEFIISITNNNSGTMAGVEVGVSFPCDIEYVSGSVSDGTEQNISNLSHPIFSLLNFGPGEIRSFSFTVLAPCVVSDCINDGDIFYNIIELDYDGGSNTVTTDPYIITTPLLVITSFNDPVMSGHKGETIFRTITIQNTRLGALYGFTLIDSNGGGISISSNLGEDVSVSENVFVLNLSGNDFMTIGDGDELFEFNEVIVITEEVLITACNFDQSSTLSNISVEWGCNDEICQIPSSSVSGYISILPNPLSNPNLEFEPVVTTPDCFCGPGGFQQGLIITNTGNEAATDIYLNISQFFSGSGIGENTVMADIDGDIIPLQAEYSNLFNSSCEFSMEIFHEFSVPLETIEAGNSIVVFWDVFFCSSSECEKPENNWTYEYNYIKDCAQPGNQYTHGSGEASGTFEGLFQDYWSYTGQPEFENAETKTISYHLDADYLTENDANLSLQFTIPCGLILTNNDWIFGDNSPQNINIETLENNTIVSLEYEMPFDSTSESLDFDVTFLCDSICDSQYCIDSLLTSCTDICESDTASGFFISSVTTFDVSSNCQNACGPELCSQLPLGYNCDGELPFCFDTIPGYAEYDFEFFRANYGLPDNDDNRKPDSSGVIDLDSIRLDRAIPGDTIRSVINSIVVIDQPEASLTYGLIELSYFAGDITFDNQIFPDISNSLRIYDSSENATYEFENLQFDQGESSKFFYNISATSLIENGYSLPQNFQYEEGDSIIFVSDHYIGYKPDGIGGNIPPLLNIVATPNIFLYENENTDVKNLFSCGCLSGTIELSGYDFKIFPGSFAIPPCEQSAYSGGSLVQFLLHEDNFFPYEYRNISQFIEWKFSTPEFIELLEAKLLFLRYQGGVVIEQNEILSFDFDNGSYIFNLEEYQSPLIDEGFEVFFQYIFDADCNIIGQYPMNATATFEYVGNLPEVVHHKEKTVTNNSFIALIPNLILKTALSDITSFDNKAIWDIEIQNSPTTSSGGISSGDAPNCWLYPISTGSLVDDFVLKDTSTGNEISQINGVFQLGNIGVNDTLNLQLIGINNSCETDSVTFKCGWNCEQFTNPVQIPCYERSLKCSVSSSQGEIEMVVTSPAQFIELCDTFFYHEIEIFNANNGSVFNLVLEAQLPTGLYIVPGSSELAYPSFLNNFTVIDNPEVIGVDFYKWNISNQNSFVGEDGLPGVPFEPGNSITLRFKTTTDCDFSSGRYIIYKASADQNCGDLANSVSRLGDPLNISGATPPYFTNLNITSEETNCNDMVEIAINGTFSGNAIAGDLLQTDLPPGILYVAGSSVGLAEPEIIANKLKWQLPVGINSIEMVFEIEGFENQGCNEFILPFYTSSTDSLVCSITGETCETNMITGISSLHLNIEKPDFEITDFIIENVGVYQGGIIADYEIIFENSGIVSSDSIVVSIYVDEDSSGDLSTGDTFVTQKKYNENVETGESVVLNDYNVVFPDNLCQLIAVISSEENCICASTVLPVSSQIVIDRGDVSVCSDEMVSLGISQIAGHTYQWMPDENVSCGACATTDFSYSNVSDEPVVDSLSLKDNNNTGCIIDNFFEITVYPLPHIIAADDNICQGEEAVLFASEGDSYVWVGNGIENPDLKIQIVSPETTSTYSVTITDSLGCVGNDEVVVNVNPLPEVNAGDDISICENEPAFLNADYNPEYDISWMPGYPYLSNPVIPNPEVLINENTVFTLTVFNENCQNSDEVAVSFIDDGNLEVSSDTTICFGDTATLYVSGTDYTYEWFSDEDFTCEDVDCTTIISAPDETAFYTVFATTPEGCVDTGFVQVTVVDDEILAIDTIAICKGDTIEFLSDYYYEEGFYCDTTVLTSGCLDIKCLSLTVHDTVSTNEHIEICEGDSIEFDGDFYYESGEYCKTFIGSTGCDSIHCINLMVYPKPAIAIEVETTTIIPGSSTMLTVNPGIYDEYSWLSTPLDTSMTCTDCYNPQITPSETTIYYVFVTDENGCMATENIEIKVEFSCDLIGNDEKSMIPNVFTPNNDDVNDIFKIAIENIPEGIISEFNIYNRWGDRIFSGTDNSGWDGKYNDELAPSDTYFYTIIVNCSDNEKQTFKGNVTLIR